jgi:hypothetical protein
VGYVRIVIDLFPIKSRNRRYRIVDLFPSELCWAQYPMHKVLLNRLNILHRRATLAIGFANKAQYRMHKLLLNRLNVLQQSKVNFDHIGSYVATTSWAW